MACRSDRDRDAWPPRSSAYDAWQRSRGVDPGRNQTSPAHSWSITRQLRLAERAQNTALTIHYNAQKLSNGRGPLWMLKFVAVFAALTVMPTNVSTQVDAAEGRIHITFLKAGYGSGSGYLFYEGQKYGLAISSTKIRRVWITTIDLIGTAFNLRSAADIIGTYTAADAGVTIVRRAKIARLENTKGVVLEIRAVNLNPWFSLNLSGMTIKNVGWQPSPE